MTVKEFRVSYFREAYQDLPGVIEAAGKALADVDFDTIVGTGFSGSIVIPALALAMDKKFVLIRKEKDDSHHGGGRLVGQLGERWIFVDDFISSGRTRQRVIQKMSEFPAVMVGQYMYHRWEGKAQFQPFDPDWRVL